MNLKIIKKISNKSEFNAVDLSKFMLAFMVISSHTQAVKNLSSTVVQDIVGYFQYILPMFFYVVSGFWIVYNTKDKENKEKIVNEQIKKLLKMYVVWTVISIPVTIYGYIISNEGILHSVLSYIKYFLFVGKLYGAIHLYYLLATVIGLVIIKYFIKNNISMGIYLIIGYSIYELNGCMLNAINSSSDVLRIIGEIYQYIFNQGSVFSGVVYMALGALIAESGLYLNKWFCFLGLLAVSILGDKGWFHVIKPMFLFMMTLDIKLQNFKIGKLLRNISALVYSSHLVVYGLYSIIIIKSPYEPGMKSFIVTSILSTLISIILLKAKDRSKLIHKIFF